MFYVYMLASRFNGTLFVGMTRDLVKRVWEHKIKAVPGSLFVGMTRDLVKRVWEHKIKAVPGFTTKNGVDRLVWYEQHDSLESAFARERQIKEWKRA